MYVVDKLVEALRIKISFVDAARGFQGFMTPTINIHAIKTHGTPSNILAPGPYRVVANVIDKGSIGMGRRVDSSPLRMSEFKSSRVCPL